MMTPKSAAKAVPQALRSRIRRALDVSRVPKSGFVDRQIALHRESQARQQSKVSVIARTRAALEVLAALAKAERWSNRKLASKIGIPDRTLRRLKQGQSEPDHYLAKLEFAVANLQPA